MFPVISYRGRDGFGQLLIASCQSPIANRPRYHRFHMPTHPFQTDDPRLTPIAEKVLASERLNSDDALALYRSPDVLALGWLANHVRERLHGNVAYFNVNRHINPTNVCVAACRLCAFGRKKDTPGAYTMALEEAWQTAASGYSEAVTEFHIVGGLHPDLPFEYFLDLIAGLKERYPNVHLKAFTMVEIAFLAKRAKLTIRETLEKLKAAGVDSLPGGGAEIFNDRVRHIICDHKIDGDQWLETARLAHQMGLRSNATMLYGHIESDEDRVDHLLRLRALQDETGGFQAFIPLAFHPVNTPLEHLPWTTGMLDIKQIAVSRLVLDNFPHIKAYWQMLTPKIAQIALRFGADDLDGTVIEEKIYHDAGATTPQGMRRQELIRLIRTTGREPVERDTLYRPVRRTETSVTVTV
jgi:aminodeoxyfutalosine synthase